jgi:hypothetical protein
MIGKELTMSCVVMLVLALIVRRARTFARRE